MQWNLEFIMKPIFFTSDEYDIEASYILSIGIFTVGCLWWRRVARILKILIETLKAKMYLRWKVMSSINPLGYDK